MTAIEPSSDTADKQYFGLPWAVAFVLAYFVFQAILVTFVSNGAGLDDAEQLANIGYLDWGYGGSQPPLYTWISNLAASVLGTSMLTLQIVKFGILMSLFLSVYGGMRLLGFSRAVASAGMLGLFLIPQIGWESQRALTHSVAGTAGCGWTFLAFAWHMRKRGAVSAAALGVAMAAALLGKLNASFFLVMIIVTGLSVAQYRAVLLSKLSSVTIIVFALCTTPTALWMLDHSSSVVARSGKLQMGATGNLIFDRINGVGGFIQAAFLFSILVLVVAAVIALIHLRKRTAPVTGFTTGETFMRRLLIVGLGMVCLGVIVSGANDVKDRWLQPVLFLAPAALACGLARYRTGERALVDFAVVGAVTSLLVPPILSYYLVYGSSAPPYGQLDYRQLYTEIEAQGSFKTILTDKPQIPGNFRLFDPSIRVVHSETPDTAEHIAQPMLVMWFGGPTPNEEMTALLERAHIAVPADGIKTADIAYRTWPDRHMTVSYFFVN